MKRFFLVVSLLITFLITSCATQLKHIPGYEITVAIDFTKYTDADFLITPHEYSGIYESIGLITTIVMPEANLETNEAGFVSESNVWKISDLNISEVINNIYGKAVQMGADAIVDFKIIENTDTYNSILPVAVTGYLISGYAIKRLDDSKLK